MPFTDRPHPLDGRARTRSLLDLDDEFTRALPAERHPTAHVDLRVHVHRRPTGPWPMEAGHRERLAPHLGVLVLEGVIASDILLEDVVSTELLGPGDILRPWPLDTAERLLSDQARWTVLADCRVALLDQRVAAALTRYPEIYAVLLERMDTRARRFATTQAIAQLNRVDRRVLSMLWHLAERWGRVTPDGVLIPLDISHRLLAQLVGARRPTVSTALGDLAREGHVQRRTDGAWLLYGDPPCATPAGQTPLSRRRLFVDQRHPRRWDTNDNELRRRARQRQAAALHAELTHTHDTASDPPNDLASSA